MHWSQEQAYDDLTDDIFYAQRQAEAAFEQRLARARERKVEPRDPSLDPCEFCGAVARDFGHDEPRCGDKARAEARRLRQIVHDAEFARTGQPMIDFS